MAVKPKAIRCAHQGVTFTPVRRDSFGGTSRRPGPAAKAVVDKGPDGRGNTLTAPSAQKDGRERRELSVIMRIIIPDDVIVVFARSAAALDGLAVAQLCLLGELHLLAGDESIILGFTSSLRSSSYWDSPSL